MPDPKIPTGGDTWITPTREDHIEIPQVPEDDPDADIEEEDQHQQPLTGDDPKDIPPPVRAEP